MKQRPNFLFLLADQHRHDWTSLTPSLAGLVRTPHLEALARRGAHFTRAVCPSPLCGPSRACLASGVDYDSCGMRLHEQNWPVERLDSHYRLMRDLAGYHVLGCGKFDLRKASPSPGPDGMAHADSWGFSQTRNIYGKWDGWHAHSHGEPAEDPYYRALEQAGLKETHIEDYRQRQGIPTASYTNSSTTPLPDALYIDNWTAHAGMDLLASVPIGEPWYLFVNFSGPHEPLDITDSMANRLADRSGFPSPFMATDDFSPAQHQRIRSQYTAMIENIDARIGDFVELLRSRGELENTIIIYSSDHGEMLGDRNRWAKSVPYHQSVGIPLIMAGPHILPGIVNASPVSLIDVAATVLDYADLSRPAHWDACSLRPILSGESSQVRSHVFSGLADWRLVDDGRFKLIRGFDFCSTGHKHGSSPDAPPLLFDRFLDPEERQNLAPLYPNEVARLSSLLKRP